MGFSCNEELYLWRMTKFALLIFRIGVSRQCNPKPEFGNEGKSEKPWFFSVVFLMPLGFRNPLLNPLSYSALDVFCRMVAIDPHRKIIAIPLASYGIRYSIFFFLDLLGSTPVRWVRS